MESKSGDGVDRNPVHCRRNYERELTSQPENMFRKKSPEPVNVEWLIIGLGNPGPEYSGTRHNIGFEVIDAVADKYRIKLDKAKHKSRYGLGVIEGSGVCLVKPMTFMNLSGQAVAPLLKEFGLKPDRLLIVADELDLPLGRLQLKPKGGTAGHNGHKSIKALIGTEDYPRLRFGINSDRKEETIDFVLSKFHPEERPDIQQLLRKAITGIETLVEQGIERAQNVVNES